MPCAIEQSDPSLKNSLINFLMFRRDATPTGRLVYRALRQRASQDLRGVNIDLAVDRTRLIYIGYAVAALMVAFTLYTILSPKDVFRTVQRVAIPWANISRPTRVTISNIQPGDAPVILGKQARISAQVTGLASDDRVRLFYRTEDHQIVNQPVSMKFQKTEQAYQCLLPEGDHGIQQDLRYYIEAGDARSPEYRLSVQRTPTIVVQRVEYEYPKYTRREPRVVTGEGEIYAIEGTRVTVHGQANFPISSAHIEFDPAGPSNATKSMQAKGQDAFYSFTLKWLEDRNGPQHNSYCLSFKTVDGRDSLMSVEHKISVTRDMPPDIEILTPNKKEIDLPANGSQLIEIRAIDPDFGLTRVALQATAGGKSLLDTNLMTDAQGQSGQTVVQYEFSPRQFDLAPGDRVIYSAVAEDNRMASENERAPNTVHTDSYVINIVAADPKQAGTQSSDRTEGQETSPGSGNAQQPTPAAPQPPDNAQSPEDKNHQNDQQSNDQSQENNQENSSQDGQSQNQADTKQQNGTSQNKASQQDSGSQSDSSQTAQPGARIAAERQPVGRPAANRRIAVVDQWRRN